MNNYLLLRKPSNSRFEESQLIFPLFVEVLKLMAKIIFILYFREKAKVTVEIVGSCATLIAGLLLTDPSATSSLTPLTAQLLYQTIVLDTLNFSPAGRVATPKDLLVAEQLSAMFATRLSREEVFQKLITAKSDVSNLSTEQVLRRDMKIVEVGEASRLRVAVCIIPVLAKVCLTKIQAIL